MTKNWLLLLITLGLFALYCSFCNTRLKMGSDSVEYIRLADSLEHGRGFTIENKFVSKWPPVTPLLHAAGMALGLNLGGLKAISGLVALIGLLAAYFLLKRRNPALAAWAAILSAVSYPMIYWVLDIASESPYLMMTMLALLAGEAALENPNNLGLAIGAGIAIGLAALTRTVGLSLLIGFGLASAVHWFRGEKAVFRPAVIAAVISLIFVGAWFGYCNAKTGETSVSVYGKYAFRRDPYDTKSKSGLATDIARAKENTAGYAFIFSIPDASLRMKNATRFNARGLLSIVIMGLALAGFLFHLIKKPSFAEFYLLVYWGALMVVAWYDIRYLVPILPLWFYYFAFSTNWLIERLARPAGRESKAILATGAVMAAFIAFNLYFSTMSKQAKRLRATDYDGTGKELHDAAMWVKDHFPNDVVVCRNANMMWFWTGGKMKVIGVPLIDVPDQMWDYLLQNKARTVIVDNDEFSGVTGKFLIPALNAHQDKTEQVASFGQTRILQLHP